MKSVRAVNETTVPETGVLETGVTNLSSDPR